MKIKKRLQLLWLWWAVRQAKAAVEYYDRTHLYTVDQNPDPNKYEELLDNYLALTHKRDDIIKSLKKQS